MDLTIIYLTINKLPKTWTEYHMVVLKEAIGDYPVISISREPMDFGTNVIQEPSELKSNIFRQILRGAKLATTPYIAIAEDDVLYPKEHFNCFRPEKDEVGYNLHRWWIHTWDEPVFSTKRKYINATMIAPRELVIKTLEERFSKKEDEKMSCEIGRDDVESKLGITPVKVREFYSNVGVVQFDHDYFFGCEKEGAIKRRHTKRPKPIKALEIPYWGRAEDLQKLI